MSDSGRSEPDFAGLERREWARPDVARAYAGDFSRAADMVVPEMVAQVAAAPGRQVLDLCCGQGNVTAGLLAAGADVTGLDFSPAMLEIAHRRAPGARLVEGDAMALAFPPERFDAVTIGFGMPHLPDPARALAEAARVLRRGGRLAYSVWCGPERASAMTYVFTAIAEFGDPAIALPPGPGANDFADPDIAFPALEDAGFADPARRIVPSGWEVDDPAAPYHYFREGTARGGALLRPQPPDRAEAIRAAVVREVTRNHGPGPQWWIPMPAAVISASRAGAPP